MVNYMFSLFWSSGEFPVPHMQMEHVYRPHTRGSIKGRARPLHLYKIWSPEAECVGYIHVLHVNNVTHIYKIPVLWVSLVVQVKN